MAFYDNVYAASGGLGLLSTFAFLVTTARKHAAEAVPWWVWWGGAGSFALVAAGNGGYAQGMFAVVAAVMFGAGAALFVPRFRARQIHFRQPEPRIYDALAEADWEHGAENINVTKIEATFHYNYQGSTIDFEIRLVNGSVHPARLAPDIRGHIAFQRLPDGSGAGFSDLPGFQEVWGTERHWIGDAEPSREALVIPRNVPVKLTIRQRMSPEVGKALAERWPHQFVFRFLNIGVLFERELPDGNIEVRERDAIPLPFVYELPGPSRD